MTTPSHLALFALLIGAVCGLRSMTAPAVVSWGAHLGWLHLAGSHLAFMANPVAVGIFTFCAVGELIVDKLPKTPARTQLGPLAVRIVFGAFCGTAFAISGHLLLPLGAIPGAAGALLGAYGGYAYRRAAVGKLPDFPVALLEDLIAVGGGLLLVSRF